MSQSAQPDASKRKRVVSPSDELPSSTTMSGSPPPDIVGGTARLPSDQTGSIDIESLLLEMIQTETGAAGLAQALRSRRVRDILKQHGVKIQTNDDVGYNSLPLELRDNIRQFAIVDKDDGEGVVCKCGRCPDLASYACIDSEWRHAVERVTFRCLRLRDRDDSAIKDLELLERYVVGSRRQYLQYLYLPVDTLKLIGESSDQDKVDNFTSPILQLFNVFNQWNGNFTTGGDIYVEFETTLFNGSVAQPFSVPLDGLQAGLTNLPTIAQIAHFCVTLWQPFDVGSLLVLLSRMPNLRSTIIMPETEELPTNGEDCHLQTMLLFRSLPQTAPNLKSLEIHCNGGWMDQELQLRFYIGALLYSQRLREFSLVAINFPELLAILTPFSATDFNPKAPPRILWSKLKDFIIKQARNNLIQDQFCPRANELMLRMGRAIRCMPRIQYLEMGLSYFCTTQKNDCRFDVVLKIESSRGSFGHSPLAKLSITNEGDKSVAEHVLSRGVTDLWKASVSKVASVILEVEVACVTQEGALASTGNQVEEIDEN